MPAALAIIMLTAVALSLVGLGSLGACLAAWQLAGFVLFGGAPPVADGWRHAGLTGELLVGLFAWLPALLVSAVVAQALIAWLGLGLLWRRPWARHGTVALAMLWATLAGCGWAMAHYALADLARGYPQHAAFAHAAAVIAGQVAFVNVGLATTLVVFLIQPAVRAQFTAGR